MQILVVDDNAINRMICESILGEAGHAVVHACGGQQAVEAVRASQYDLVLMDIRMPEVDGVAATRRIRALGGLAGRTPVLALSGYDAREDLEAMLAAGGNGHVPKPIEPDALLAAVREYADGHAPSTPMIPPPLPAATADEPLLDDGIFGRLRARMPGPVFGKALNSYLAAAAERLARIEGLARRGDHAGLAGQAHDLISASGTFGAARVRQLSERLNAACKANDGAEALAIVAAIRDASRETWALMRRQIEMPLDPILDDPTGDRARHA